MLLVNEWDVFVYRYRTIVVEMDCKTNLSGKVRERRIEFVENKKALGDCSSKVSLTQL